MNMWVEAFNRQYRAQGPPSKLFLDSFTKEELGRIVIDQSKENGRLNDEIIGLVAALPDPAILHYAADWWRLEREQDARINKTPKSPPSALEQDLLRFAKQSSEAKKKHER